MQVCSRCDYVYDESEYTSCPYCSGDVGRILRTFKIKKNVEVTDNGKDNF